MNNKYKIKVGHPLVRPGLTIETEASERYLTSVVNCLLSKVREINTKPINYPEPKTFVTTKDGIEEKKS